MRDRRIVVTGMGVVSPLGADLQTFHESLQQGKSGISTIETRFETGYRVNRAGMVREFDDSRFVDGSAGEAVGRTAGLGLTACAMAQRDAGLEGSTRCGIVVGTAMGEALEREAVWEERQAAAGGADDAHARYDTRGIHRKIAAALGLDGPGHLVASTCASGNHAIDWACDLLGAGEADAMLAVGVDTIGHVDLLGFSRLLLQAPDACRPFDLHRKGTILSEGAGALLLEPLPLAAKRSANILAEVAGCGLSCDAGGAFKSSVSDVRTLGLAAESALHEARISPQEIDFISAHGSGTRLNDARETQFARSLLGPHADRVPMSSIKSMLGHGQGAAAAFEAIACVLSLQHGVLYPTINFETPDPQCDMDCVPNTAREARVDVIMSNAFGVGGNNSIIVLKRWKGA